MLTRLRRGMLLAHRWWSGYGRREPSGGRGYLLAVISVLLVSAVVAVLEHIWPTGSALSMLYLIAVLAVASVAGRGPAILASVLAFLAFNFLFVTPHHTFIVADPIEWLTLLLLLVTAVVTGHLTAALRHQAQAAEQRAREMATLYDLSQALMAEVGLPPMLQVITDRVVSVFGVDACAILLREQGDEVLLAAATGDVTTAAVAERDVHAVLRQVMAEGKPVRFWPRGRGRRLADLTRQPRWRALCLPLQTGGRTLGVLLLRGRPEAAVFTTTAQRTLATFAAQAALAISHAHLAEEATRAEVLRRSDALKSALLSSVSHDLRTPLASIKAAVTSLLQAEVAWDAAAQRELLMAIDEETDRLTRLVTNLLDVSRIEAGILRPAADWNSVGEVVAGVLDRLAPHLVAHPLQVAVPDELPLARFDYVHLEQALTNLLENAAKYTPPGSPIEVTACHHEDSIELRVVDHGPGIPAGERERVFDKFYRLAPTGSGPGATGLGLAIARGLVAANSGRLWAEETPGGGATLRLTLPLNGDTLAAEPLPTIHAEARP